MEFGLHRPSARGKHKACIKDLPNQGRVNQVFEHAGVPYRPHLEPGSEASVEVARKRKINAGVGTLMKHVKGSGRKAAPTKTMVVKAAQSKSAPEEKTMPEAGVASKAVASSATPVSKVAVTMTSPRIGVLKVSVGTKLPSADPS
jgi:hypothetical protein